LARARALLGRRRDLAGRLTAGLATGAVARLPAAATAFAAGLAELGVGLVVTEFAAEGVDPLPALRLAPAGLEPDPALAARVAAGGVDATVKAVAALAVAAGAALLARGQFDAAGRARLRNAGFTHVVAEEFRVGGRVSAA
jgi:hypothetical protein